MSDRLLQLLKKLEFSVTQTLGHGESITDGCPVCYCRTPRTHEPDCELARLIKELELKPVDDFELLGVQYRPWRKYP